MVFDFTLSIDGWLALFQQLLDIFSNFFERLGIKLFADKEESTTAAN